MSTKTWAAIDVNERPSLTAVSTVDSTVIVRLTADPATGALLVSSGGSGGFTELDPTGAVNGINQTFVFSQTPTYIVSDGAWYKPLDSNGNVQWSGTTTVTITIPPSFSIYGFA